MDPFESAREGDILPILELVEHEIRENHHPQTGGPLLGWYECALQLVFWYTLFPILPADWTLEQEVRAGSRRADLVLTAPDGEAIMIELKYVRIDRVAIECRSKSHYHRARAAYRVIEDAEDVLDLEHETYDGRTRRIRDEMKAIEIDSDKFAESAAAVDALRAYVVVGVGHRLAVLAELE